MDKQEKLNDLFRKAKAQEPQTSFEQTKGRFLNSLENQLLNTKSSQVYNFKKWIIMLSSIMTVVGITIFLSTSNSIKIKDDTIKNFSTQKEIENKLQNTDQTKNKLLKNLELKSQLSDSKSNLFNNSPSYFKNEFLYLPVMNYNMVLNNKYQNIPFDDTLKTASIVIPILSEKEVKANNKQKKLILKAAVKEDLESYCYVPSGSFNYEDQTFSVQGFYMCKTEVTNLEYRTFLNDLIIQKRFEEYKLAKPDDSLWLKMYGKGMEMMSMYTTHPAYNNYPITNISRKGAELYIQWLNSEIPPKEKDIILTDYRIPTRLEWVYAASSQGKQFPYPWNGEFMRDSKGLYLANYKPFPQRFADDGGFSSVKVDSYYPNELGLYNMCGNVAEMVDNMEFKEIEGKKIWTKVGIGTAGGGWLEQADDIKITGKDNYDGVSNGHPNIGFRYVKTFKILTW